MSNLVYMDHAATTPMRSEVVDAMVPYLREHFGNPSSIYSIGRASRQAMNKARETVAGLLGARPEEIIFTGGGSESDNMAIRGIAEVRAKKGKHIITSAVEHHAVFHTVEYLEKQGFAVTYLPVDEFGMVSPAAVAEAINDETILVTIMHGNNEVGTINPISEIGAICREKGIVFHTDAVQTVGHVPVDVNDLNVDLLTLSAHKFYGPKGVGALYVRKGVRVPPLISGGGQERGKRAGTENVAGVIGLATALELAVAEMDDVTPRVTNLRDMLLDGIVSGISHVKVNGPRINRLPGNVNVCFKYIEGESLLLNLDMRNIAASSGSACTSGSLDPSHVLLAMGLEHEIAHGSLRLTLGRDNTEADVNRVLEVLPQIVDRLRAMSPLVQG